jgi:hypothetical protein
VDHYSSFGHCSAADIEGILKSQLDAGAFISQTTNSVVFDEGLTEDLNRNWKEFKFESAEAVRLFPDGVPLLVADLTQKQRDFILDKGIAKVLFLLEKTPELHATMTREEGKEIEDRIDRKIKEFKGNFDLALKSDEEFRALVTTEREKRAAAAIINFFSDEKNKDRIAILVFGNGHDFRDDFANKNVAFSKKSFVETTKDGEGCEKSTSRPSPDKGGGEK